MAREEKGFSPEAWTPTHAENIDHEIIKGGKEGAETPMEDRKLEHHLLTCPEKDLQLFKEYLTTYQKTDTLFDSMRKAKGEEKTNLKQEWSNMKERLADARIILPKELRTLLEEVPGFGRKQTMRGLEFLVVDVTGRRGASLQEAVQRQAEADKKQIHAIRKTLRKKTAQQRTHTIPHVENDVKPATQRAGWFKRNARRVALALLPFIGGAIDTSASQKGEEEAQPAGITDTMREEESPPLPLISRIEFSEEEGTEIVSQKPKRVVTREKIRKAVERRTARERHEAELRSTGIIKGMTPEEEVEFATPLAQRMKRKTETFEPLDTSAGVAETGGRSRDLYENLQAMDPTGAGTHVPLREDEIRTAAKEARDRVLGKYGVSEDNDDSQAGDGPRASRE